MKRVKEIKAKALENARKNFIPGPYPHEDMARWEDLVDEEFTKLIVYEILTMVTYREGDEILERFGIVDKSRF